MAEIATQDNAALLQSLLGAITSKSSSGSGSSATTTSGTTATTSSQNTLQQLLNTLMSSQNTTGNTNSAQTSSQNQTNTSSGGSVSTTKSDISAEGINKMLMDALSAAGSGVADIAQGAHIAGIYDSSTQQLLTNDLLSRTAGELAKAQAGTTTTTTNSGVNTVSGTNNTNIIGSNNSTTTGTSSQNQSITGSQTGSSNVVNNSTQNQNSNYTNTQESPLRNIDFSALAGAGGLGLLAQLLGPSLQGGVQAATGGLGLSGVGDALRNLLFPSQGPMIGPNQTSGSGIGQIGSSQLTPQQLEALLNNTGGFDISSYLDPNVGSADFWSSIGIDPNSITADNSGGVGDWWDPNWLP